MSRLLALVSLVALGASACERPAERTDDRQLAARVMTGLLAYPRSTVVNVSTGHDAAQVTLATPEQPDRVAAWYREMLRLNGWELQSDGVTNEGSVSIYAEKGKQPVWITLRATVGGPGTTYTLIGAELPQDSAPQRSGSSMSSNRIQRR